MHKIKLKLFLLLTTLFVATSSLIAQQHANVVVQKLEGFEKPDDWVVKFSGLRCDKWQKPISMPSTNEQTQANNGQAQANTQAPATTTQQAPTQQDENTASAQSYSSNSEWIKWLNSDNYSPDQKRNVVPSYGMAQVDKTTEKSILGVKGCWSRPGFNWLAVEPKNPLYTPEEPATLSLWVWGANFYYDLYVIVKNSDGYYYTLFLGTLNFYGWRNMRINFPSYVFPKNIHASSTKLQIVRLKVVGSPGEDPDGFYTYFDYMQIGRNIDTSPLSDDALKETQW